MDFKEQSITTYSGLSSETKPTFAAGTEVPNGSRWREVDTGQAYFYNLADDAWHTETNIYYPVPINGESVFVSDLDLDYCSFSAGWTGDFADLFDGRKTAVVNTTSNNPKTITLSFKQGFQTNIFGVVNDSGTGDFSNLKVYSTIVNTTIPMFDLSAIDTKLTEYIPQDLAPVVVADLTMEFHTADPVTISFLQLSKALQRISRQQAVSELTGNVENINSFRNAQKVDTAFVHKVGVSEYFHRETGTSTTLAAAAAPGDTSITVVDTTGFSATVGLNEMKIQQNGLKEVGILNITVLPGGNVITLDRPLSFEFPIGADVIEVNTNLASLAGTLTAPVIYSAAPPAGEIWQLSRTILSMLDGSAMDDGKFGGIPRLINGVVLRGDRPGGVSRNVTAWKTNGQIAEDMFDAIYTPKAPAGQYGLRGRWTFTKEEFIVELDGDNGDSAQALVQDDLTDMDYFTIKGKGRLFGG